jgi:hypothetical protein
LIQNWPRVDFNQIIDAEKKKKKRREKYLIRLKKKRAEKWEEQRKIIRSFFDIDKFENKYDPTILPSEKLYYNSCK